MTPTRYHTCLQMLLLTSALGAAGVHAAHPITVENARISQPPPGINVAAGYLDIRHQAPAALQLTAVTSPRFGSIEMHETVTQNGMASMKKLAGVAIAPGTTFSFSPGAAHLMLFNAAPPLQLEEQVPVTLHFDDGTAVEFGASVVPITDLHTGHSH